MTPHEQLQAIQERADGATPGPWVAWNDIDDTGVQYVSDGGDPGPEQADAEFIAQARTDVPRLLAALRAVLDLHRPTYAGSGAECIECGSLRPCPTVHAITEALA